MLKDDTTMYGTHLNILMTNQCLAANLSPDLTLTSQRRTEWLVSFSTIKTKQITFHPNRADPEPAPILIRGHSPRDSLAWTTTGCKFCVIAKTLEEWMVPCIDPENNSYCHPLSLRVRSEQVLLSYLGWHFPVAHFLFQLYEKMNTFCFMQYLI